MGMLLRRNRQAIISSSELSNPQQAEQEQEIKVEKKVRKGAKK